MALVGTCGFGTIVRLGGGDLGSFLVFLVLGISAFMAASGPTALLHFWYLDPLAVRTELFSDPRLHIVLTKLHAVGLRGAADMMPAQLSGGMARRVALARAMVMDPDILIYDEPFVGLDPISMGVIVRLVRRMNDALGISSIIVSHDVQEISTVADCSYLISKGKVAASGSPDELSEASSDLVRQFMHGMADGPVAFHYDAPDYAEQLLGRDAE